MRDLMKSYKMRIQRKESGSDSDSESQPLVSSASSSASFGTLNERCMFHPDSDTTDCELDRLKTTPAPQTSPAITTKSILRRPFCFPGPYDSTTDRDSSSDAIIDRFQYFAKGDRPLISDDSLLMPKVLTQFKDYGKMDEQEEAQQEECHETQNSVVTIFSIWNTIMGSSILAMSWGIEKAGLIPGLAMIILVGGICLYTAYVILRVNEDHGIYRHNEVPDLCRVLLGKWAEVLARLFSQLVLAGANIVYWILMSNFLFNTVHVVLDYALFTDVKKENETVLCPRNMNVTQDASVDPNRVIFDRWWTLYGTVPIFLGVAMFALLNFKKVTFFTKFTSLGTISVMNVLLFVTIKAAYWGVNIPDWTFELNVKSTFCALTGMLSLSFFIHNIVISIVKNNKNQRHNARDLSIAYFLATFTYIFVGGVFYVSYPYSKNCIEDNILNNFPKHDTLSMIARILLLFQLITVYPLIAFMLRTEVLNCFGRANGKRHCLWKVVLFNVAMVTLCILFACFLPKIGTLIRYIGALAGFAYIFTFPALLKMASLRKKRLLTAPRMIFYGAIILIGVANLISQFFISD